MAKGLPQTVQIANQQVTRLDVTIVRESGKGKRLNWAEIQIGLKYNPMLAAFTRVVCSSLSAWSA